MYSLLGWIGVLVILGGLVGSLCPQWTELGWRDSIFGLVILSLVLVHFAYFHKLHRTHSSLPDGSVAIVVAFEAENADAELAGLANRDLANWLDNNARKFSLIMTQEAVIWALDESGKMPSTAVDVPRAGHLHDVEVRRIHRHIPGANVRTLETLCCAKQWFGNEEPETIVLVAHPKHYERACRDLRSQFKKSRIVNSGITEDSYSTDFFLNPIIWAGRELLVARPMEYWMRKGKPACRPDVTWGADVRVAATNDTP